MNAEDKMPSSFSQITSVLKGSYQACCSRNVAWECPTAAGGNLARGLLSDVMSPERALKRVTPSCSLIVSPDDKKKEQQLKTIPPAPFLTW